MVPPDTTQIPIENMTSDSSWRDPVYQANFYCIIGLVIIGVVCNVLSMGVFASSHSLRRTTTGHYLIALAAADLLFLCGEFVKILSVRDSQGYIVNFTLMNTIDALCKVRNTFILHNIIQSRLAITRPVIARIECNAVGRCI